MNEIVFPDHHYLYSSVTFHRREMLGPLVGHPKVWDLKVGDRKVGGHKVGDHEVGEPLGWDFWTQADLIESILKQKTKNKSRTTIKAKMGRQQIPKK